VSEGSAADLLTPFGPPGINNVLYFPYTSQPDQLKRINSAVVQGSLIEELIRCPDHSQGSVNTNDVNMNPFIGSAGREGRNDIGKITDRSSLYFNNAGPVVYRLQAGAIREAVDQAGSVASNSALTADRTESSVDITVCALAMEPAHRSRSSHTPKRINPMRVVFYKDNTLWLNLLNLK